MESVETKEIIAQFRKKMGLSQNELAEKLFVTRQAVSRYDTGYQYPKTAFYAVWRIRQYAFRIASASGLSVLRDAFRG